MINVGVIGYGYWGPNLVRNFADLAEVNLAAVCDVRDERLAQVRRRYPAAAAHTDPQVLMRDASIDAVAIATPVSSHFELALEALQADKHVLVEKPLAASSDEARRLIDEADRRCRVLMVDHTFVYTGAVQKIHELVQSRSLGELHYYDSVRVNLGLFQHDVSVLWDLAVHDLSIMDFVLPVRPTAVSATAMGHVSGQPKNIAYLTLFFDGSLIAHVHVNWLAPVKLRKTLIAGSRKMIVYDDLEPSEKVKVYDKGITVDGSEENLREVLIGYRTGDMLAPRLDGTEALRTEAAHFVECVSCGRSPITDGQAGLRVVQILEAATRSLAGRGQPLDITLVEASS